MKDTVASRHAPSFRSPARLRAGDTVAVVAPSGPVPREAFEAGAAVLGARYRLRYDERLFARTGFLAGSDARRRDELLAVLEDPEVRAIVCARGGYGAMRLLPSLPLEPLARDPRVLVGFSDITALHALWQRAGLRSIHGPVVTQLGNLRGEAEALFSLLESSAPPPAWRGLRQVAPGRAEGRAVGGNLEVLTRLVGTPWMPPLESAVLFVEEIGERPYRLDRQLLHLQLAGALERVAAVVVGDLVRCDEPDRSSDPHEAVSAVLASLGVPVVAGAPFGHGERNRPFPLGASVLVDADAGVVAFGEGAVA